MCVLLRMRLRRNWFLKDINFIFTRIIMRKNIEMISNKYADRIDMAYVIHPKNFKMTEKIMYLPAYMIMCIGH